MKNNKCLFIFIIFTLFLHVSAFSSDFHFSVQPQITVHWGQQDEFVYLAYDGGEKRTLSELNWEQKPLFMPGIKGRLGYKNLFLELGAKTALQENCGTVYDSDWLNVSALLGCSDDYASIKTNYSESDCVLDSYYQLSAKLEYQTQINQSITFSPFAEFEYSYSSYYAKEGWALYSNDITKILDGYYHSYSDPDNSYEVTFSGNVMQLERITYFTWLGAELNASLSPKVSLAFSFALSPFVYIQSLDSHLLKGTYYLDEMYGILKGTREELSFTFRATEKSSIIFSIQGYMIENLTGTAKSTSKKNAAYKDYTDCSYTVDGKSVDITSGSAFYSLDFTLAYRLTFK